MADWALRIVNSSPTLFLDQDQQTPLMKQPSGVQLELTGTLNDLTPEHTAQAMDNGSQLVDVVERASRFGKIVDADHIQGGM